MKKRLLIGSGLTVATGSVFAAVPAAVTTALTDAGTDAATVGGAVLVVIVGIAAFKYMRRAL
jgi:hypothetical protein